LCFFCFYVCSLSVCNTHKYYTYTQATSNFDGLFFLVAFHCIAIITFRVSRRRHEMYCGHARLCVCLSAAYCTDPDVTWGSGRGCPLVVHYWADLQSVHGLRCYGNITRMRNVSEYMLVLALCLVMVAICNRADHYILPCGFYLSFSPRLISAVGDWMSTILPHMVWP